MAQRFCDERCWCFYVWVLVCFLYVRAERHRATSWWTQLCVSKSQYHSQEFNNPANLNASTLFHLYKYSIIMHGWSSSCLCSLFLCIYPTSSHLSSPIHRFAPFLFLRYPCFQYAATSSSPSMPRFNCFYQKMRTMVLIAHESASRTGRRI